MPNETEKWRKFDLLLANFQAIGKWQSRFVNALIAFICLVWVVDLMHSSGGITVQVLGATVQIQGFWQIVPLVNGILSLGLIGSINIIHQAWRRLDLYLVEVFSDPSFFFAEFDPHKSILDYIGYLSASLKKPVLPDTADNITAEDRKWSPTLFLYPGLILLSIFTTSFTLRRIQVNWWSIAYVFSSTFLQAFFSFPFIWRKACLFTGAHKSPDEGMDWGDAAFHEMSLEAMQRLIERNRPKAPQQKESSMHSSAEPTGGQPGAPEPTIPIHADAARSILEVSDKIAISAGLLTAIILFFEDKTPVVVVVLLTVGFACGLYVLGHLLRFLPWVAKAKGKANWSFVGSIIVAGVIWATLVGWYGVKKWPKRELIVLVSFKDSSVFTPKRRKRIEIELDDYYRYLRNLGFDFPKEIPPLGVSPAHGPILVGGSQGPNYYSSLVISEDAIDAPGIVPTVYSSYTFNRLLVWPNAWNPTISRTEAENDEVAAWIYSCYYPASFSGHSVCDKNAPGHKWVGAMWDVKQKYGQEYADALMCYTLKMWRDIPSKYADNFDRFFRYKLVAGETVKDNSADRHRELDGIFRQHEIDVSQP